MPITEAQRQARKNHLGSSDLPAIMGFSRFATAYDIWLEKTGRLPIEAEAEKKEYQVAGSIFEEGVLKWASEHAGLGEIIPSPELAVPDTPIIVHPDGLLVRDNTPVEAKTEGLYGPIISPWGEVGTDEVPEYTFIQGHCHMMATDRDICHVPTFLGGRGYGYFFIKRDETIVNLIKAHALQFWHEHVLKNVPPADSIPSLDAIKRIRRIEGAQVQLADELVAEWIEAKERKSEAEKAAKEAQAAVLAALDGAELGACSLGEVTNFEQHRKECIQKASDFRVLRLRKKK